MDRLRGAIRIRRTRRIRAVGAALVAALALAGAGGLGGCGTPPAEPEPRADDTVIRLGALFPVSGTRASAGKRASEAAQLAVDEANAAGGVLGRRIELIIEDDACDAGTAVTGATKLVAQEIVVSVGGACSVASVPASKIFDTARVPMILPTSNSSDLLAPGYNTVFLVSGTTTAEARFALAQLRRLGAHKVSVIDDKTTYSSTMAKAAVDLAAQPETGIALANHLELTQGAPSHRRTVDEVIRAGADAVFFTGYSAEASQLILDLRTAGYPGAIILGDGATDPLTFGKLTAAQSDGVYNVANPVPEYAPDIAEWTARYEAAYGDPPGPSTMQAYDAVTIALDAIRRAGTLDRARVRAAIANTQDLVTLTGPVRFNPDGSRADPRFLLLRAHNNKFELAPAAS